MKKIATIILNRNLPEVTNALYKKIHKYDGSITDIFVMESGSSKERLSKHYSWWANWPEALEHGLRFPRGFNYALAELYKKNKFVKYDYYLLICNDTEFKDDSIVRILREELDNHRRVGIISPCSTTWGERSLIGEKGTKYFWNVQFLCCMLRREFIETVMETDNPDYTNFLFDGSNFHGAGADLELIAKGYANDWATAITTKAFICENEMHLKTKADLIKTETYSENLKQTLADEKKWLRKKYGFNSRWTMQLYSKFFYEKFFDFFPEFKTFKI